MRERPSLPDALADHFYSLGPMFLCAIAFFGAIGLIFLVLDKRVPTIDCVLYVAWAMSMSAILYLSLETESVVIGLIGFALSTFAMKSIQGRIS